MTTEHKPQKERLNIERAIERIEWMHYLGTKTFPHDAGWDEGCELCNAEAEVRETLLAARRLEEQLQTAEGTSEVLASHLAAASEKITGLEEQYQAALDALREASLHQGLPEDAPPDRIAAHFRGNREFAGGFRKIAEESSPAREPEA